MIPKKTHEELISKLEEIIKVLKVVDSENLLQFANSKRLESFQYEIENNTDIKFGLMFEHENSFTYINCNRN